MHKKFKPKNIFVVLSDLIDPVGSGLSNAATTPMPLRLLLAHPVLDVPKYWAGQYSDLQLLRVRFLRVSVFVPALVYAVLKILVSRFGLAFQVARFELWILLTSCRKGQTPSCGVSRMTLHVSHLSAGQC